MVKNLESMLTDLGRFDNRLEDINGLFDHARDMISQYTAGKQEQHLRAVSAIEYKYNNGLDTIQRRTSYARRELARLIGSVCQVQKVLK